MIVGTSVALRPYRLDDLEAIHRWKNDFETTKWMGRRFRSAITLEQARASLEAALATPETEARFFALCDPITLAYRGGIDLTDLDLVDRRGTLSIVVATPGDRGRGVGREAIRLLLGQAFGPWGLHRVTLNVVEANVAALRCYLACGFRLEGRLRDHVLVEGRYYDLLTLGILETEFRSEG